jgi:hypothetical protein
MNIRNTRKQVHMAEKKHFKCGKRIIISGISLFILSAVSGKEIKAAPFEVIFESKGYLFDNADLNKYNQSKYQENSAVQSSNTDDKTAFALSSVMIKYRKNYLNSEFIMDVKADGFWGNDNLDKNSKSSLKFENLFAKTYFWRNSYFSIGRQSYEIGDSVHEYFFNSKVDGATLNLSIDIFGFPLKASGMGDVIGISYIPPNTDTFSAIRKDDEQTEDYRGNTVSTRGGGKVEYLFIKYFYYYTRYAASSKGGTDVNQNGFSDLNKVDGDYFYMRGFRLYRDLYFLGKFDYTNAKSDGYDYQYNRDKRYKGSAYVFNYEFNLNKTPYVPVFKINNVKFYYSKGKFSENFCGMESDSLGGLLLGDYYGYRTSAIAGAYHFVDYAKNPDSPTYVDRSVSKQFTRFGAGLSIFLFEFDFGITILRDYTGEKMGKLNTFSVKYKDENLTLHADWEYFTPGEYYIKTGETNHYVPCGKDRFSCISAGAIYNFTLID